MTQSSVAEVYDALGVRGDSVLAKTRLLGRWLLVPPASGVECARALLRAGFHLRHQEGPQILLARANRIVRVPLVDRLPPELLVMILRTAGVGVAEFTNCLDAGWFAPGT